MIGDGLRKGFNDLIKLVILVVVILVIGAFLLGKYVF